MVLNTLIFVRIVTAVFSVHVVTCDEKNMSSKGLRRQGIKAETEVPTLGAYV